MCSIDSRSLGNLDGKNEKVSLNEHIEPLLQRFLAIPQDLAIVRIIHGPELVSVPLHQR